MIWVRQEREGRTGSGLRGLAGFFWTINLAGGDHLLFFPSQSNGLLGCAFVHSGAPSLQDEEPCEFQVAARRDLPGVPLSCCLWAPRLLAWVACPGSSTRMAASLPSLPSGILAPTSRYVGLAWARDPPGCHRSSRTCWPIGHIPPSPWICSGSTFPPQLGGGLVGHLGSPPWPCARETGDGTLTNLYLTVPGSQPLHCSMARCADCRGREPRTTPFPSRPALSSTRTPRVLSTPYRARNWFRHGSAACSPKADCAHPDGSRQGPYLLTGDRRPG